MYGTVSYTHLDVYKRQPAASTSPCSNTFRGRQVTVNHTGRLRVASFLEAAEVAARSDRIVVLPSFTAAAHLENGTLARVLPALKLPTLDAQLVHPQRHRGSLVLRDLGDLVAAALEVAERAGNAKRAVP